MDKKTNKIKKNDGTKYRTPSQVILSGTLYDKWEMALREDLKERYPNNAKQMMLVDESVLKTGHENFIFKGIIFVNVNKEKTSG